jgi:hypothetical protein
MLANLLLGTGLIAATVVIHTAGLILLSRAITKLVFWFRLHRHDFWRTLAMVATVMGLFAIHTTEVWLWAVTYLEVKAAQTLGDALFLSTASFSTLGAERTAASQPWQLLIALESVDGFILIGWSIAFLVAASTRHGPFREGEHF